MEGCMDLNKFTESEVKGSELGVKRMLFYYASSLQDSGVEDVRQYIATKLPEMIELATSQAEFVATNIQNDNKILDSLKDSIKLLSAMQEKKEYDETSVNIIKSIFENIIRDIDDYTGG